MSAPRFIAIAIATLLFGTQTYADSQKPETSLQKVFAHPLAYNGRTFEGYVYLYVDETGYYLFPHLTTKAEFEASDINILPGSKSEDLKLAKYKTGDRLLLRGRINVDTACFEPGTTCVPFHHLITLDEPVVIQR
jgi:hypothetical protein